MFEYYSINEQRRYMTGVVFFFFKQETAYEMRISDWSSDVCSSDLWGDRSRRSRDRRRAACPTGASRPAPTSRRSRERARKARARQGDRKSVVSGKSVSVLVDLGGRGIIKIKKYNHNSQMNI